MTVHRIIYTVLMYLLTPLFVLRLLWRSRANPAYRQRMAERFGFAPTLRPCLWLHAVSVGETIAARPLVERLLQAYPHYPLLVTTTTPTGFGYGETLVRGAG